MRKLEANVKIDSIPSKISGDKGGNGNGNIKSNGKAKNKGGPQYETELESCKFDTISRVHLIYDVR